ncbi:serine/arginine repetitive matrix protein 1-like [Anolis carolinensis]|uniref:serine/arginine repetitive matrix protein 1-like n=1 Tax=Anolis carolinensis TaxID=28377 RepID=UPI002F2B17EB
MSARYSRRSQRSGCCLQPPNPPPSHASRSPLQRLPPPSGRALHPRSGRVLPRPRGRSVAARRRRDAGTLRAQRQRPCGRRQREEHPGLHRPRPPRRRGRVRPAGPRQGLLAFKRVRPPSPKRRRAPAMELRPRNRAPGSSGTRPPPRDRRPGVSNSYPPSEKARARPTWRVGHRLRLPFSTQGARPRPGSHSLFPPRGAEQALAA